MSWDNYWKRMVPCVLLLVALVIMMLRHYWDIGGPQLYFVANVVAVLAALYLATQASTKRRRRRVSGR